MNEVISWLITISIILIMLTVLKNKSDIQKLKKEAKK